MAVRWIAAANVVEPLLHLSVAAYLQRGQTLDVFLKTLAQALVNTQNLGRLYACGVNVVYDGTVDGGHHGHTHVLAVLRYVSVFRRNAWAGDQITGARVFNHVVDEELGGLLQQGISGLGEPLLVLCIQIVAPQVGCYPRSACDVESPAGAPSRRRVAPGVAHGVGHPSAAAVNLARGLGTFVGQEGDIIEQRNMALGQVHTVGRPVVLRNVDVKMVIARPRHVARAVVVPYSLKVGAERRAVGSRRGDEHVAAILEEEGVKPGVGGSGLGQVETRVCGKVAARGVAERYVHAVEEGSVVGHVGRLESVEAFGRRPVEVVLAEPGVVLIIIIGAHVDEYCQARRLRQ